MQDRAIRFWLGVVVCFGVLLIVACCSLAGVRARNLDGRYDNAPFHEWFEAQHNEAGGWCCNSADGHQYDGEYTINDDGTVTAQWDGKPVTIEAFKVLKTPNPTGHAVWWYLTREDGMPSTFCFSPGPLT